MWTNIISLLCLICVPLVSGCIYVSLWPPLLSPSESLGWSLFLPSFSFLILFISHRDAPQRPSVELSDLNKCLRLEPGLSCGLGCWCGSRCSSHSALPWRLNESLSKPPSLPPPSVTLSLQHLFLMAQETCRTPRHPSRQTRMLWVGVFFPVTVVCI